MSEISVLIVDDEIEFASTLAERLKLRDFWAMSANCAEDALALLISTAFDVVVLDINLPDMNGLEILGLIKEIQPSTEIILLTGHGAIYEGVDGVVQGAFDFLMKPVAMNTFLEKIQQAAKKSQENKKNMERVINNL